MKLIATLVTAVFVLLLFRLERDKNARTSAGLWVAVIWFAIICSRPVSQWIHPPQNTDFVDRFTEGSPLDAGAYGVLILAGLLVLNQRAARVKSFLQANLPIVLYFFYCAVSISWSDDPAIAGKRWIKAIGDVVMVLVVLSDEHAETAIKRLYTRVGFVLLPLSVLFILYYPVFGTTYNASEHVTMYTGVATFKNLLGVLCMACGLGELWMCIGAWQDRDLPNRTRYLIAHGINLLLAIGLVVRADSMTSLSSFALGGMVLIASSLKGMRRRPAALMAVALFAIAAAGFTLFLDTGGGVLQELGRNPTLTGRTKIWQAVLAQPINPLIGAGFESFWMGNRMQSVWDLSQVGIQQAHDGYLELYINIGWIGLVLLGVLIVTGYRNGLALYRSDVQAGRLRIALLTAAVVYAFTEAGFRMLSPDWFGFLLAVTAIPVMAVQAQAVRPAVVKKPRQTAIRILQ